MTIKDRAYRKSSYSTDSSDCVEVGRNLDCVRDSKNPGADLPVGGLGLFLRELRSGRFLSS
jgi:hypothetical protein